jgi:hypothetical protein
VRYGQRTTSPRESAAPTRAGNFRPTFRAAETSKIADIVRLMEEREARLKAERQNALDGQALGAGYKQQHERPGQRFE